MNIQEAKTSELVKFYNDNVPAEKQIKKFRDRATAEKRCAELVTSVTPKVITSKAELKEAAKHIKKPKVGDVIKAGILDGKQAKVIVAEVKEKFPQSKCSVKDVAWWRFELRKAGNTIPESHYVRKQK